MPNLYVILDKKSQSSLSSCFDSMNDETVCRQIGVIMRNDSNLFTFADDYDIYQSAELDLNTGIISPVPLRHVTNLRAIKNTLIKLHQGESNNE